MQCEACGDKISLSTAHRKDGQFVCPDCHASGRSPSGQRPPQQQQRQRQAQRQAPAQAARQTHNSALKTQSVSSGENQSGNDSTQRSRRSSTKASSGMVNRQQQPTSSAPPVQEKFKTFLWFGRLLQVSGWIFVLLGGFGTLMGFAGLAGMQESMMAGIAGAVLLPGGILTLAQGFLLVVLGQQTSCFVAIERNTRSTYELMQTQQE